MLYLCSNTPCYNRLQEEIDNAINKGLISSPIKDSEARQLPYLQAVIREGLRIFPVVTATFFKRVPKGGDTVSGYFLPEGTEVGHNVLGIMRSEKYWGTDADAFRPERWLEADDATFEVMVNALETLWGAGRYKCLGRAIAQVELNKVFVEVSSLKPHDGYTPVTCALILTSAVVETLQFCLIRTTRSNQNCQFGLLSDVGYQYASNQERLETAQN